MASGPLVGGGGGGSGDGPSRDKQRWVEDKVYRRKSFNKNRVFGSAPSQQPQSVASQPQPPSSQTLPPVEEAVSSQDHNFEAQEQPPQPPPPPPLLPPPPPSQQLAVSDDSTSLPAAAPAAPRDPPPVSNGFLSEVFDNRVTINLATRSKQDLRELRQQLTWELHQVRALARRLEPRTTQVYSNSRLPAENGAAIAAPPKRVISEAPLAIVPREQRPIRSLSVSVFPHADVVVEKRTPKANQFYRNSEFLLGKDRLPPQDSSKKPKSNGKEYSGPPIDRHLAQAFKQCANLLSKLMKHKHGWVFNSPVDAEKLGLHDYFTIIRRPMDLGTVKARLSKNWYKTPREFAEDVRLTFRNAMTYNPRGQDVHIMAEQLSEIFEERYVVIETEYNHRPRFDYLERELAPLAPTTPHVVKKPLVLPLPELTRTLDRSESTTRTVDSKSIPVTYTPTGRVGVPKKPKAKDPNKRDMTYEEKQRLSANLVNLPSEKLDNVVQIIKKRNSELSQHDNEIEVDIDSFDAETLWELDRFVTNYKKSLSKNKRKAERAIQAKMEAGKNGAQEMIPAPTTVELEKESKATDDKNITSSPIEVEKPGDNASRSSSSSSSSSDSGSSSSDSDSESSSGSDAGHSPRT